MKKENTIVVKIGRGEPIKDGPEWQRALTMTDEEVMAAALSDPDAHPMTAAQLRRLKPALRVEQIRKKLSLTQRQFARKFDLPLEKVQEWEGRLFIGDPAVRALLRTIEYAPETVARAVGTKKLTTGAGFARKRTTASR